MEYIIVYKSKCDYEREMFKDSIIEDLIISYIIYRINDSKNIYQEKHIYERKGIIDSKESYVKSSWKTTPLKIERDLIEVLKGYNHLEIIGECKTSRDAYDLAQMDNLLR